MSDFVDLEKALRDMSLKTKPETDKHILKDAFAQLEKTKKSTRGDSQRDTFSGGYIKLFIKVAAAAAVLLIAVYIYTELTKPTGKAAVINAIANAENIGISSYRPGQTEPYEQVWISQKMKLTRTLNEGEIESVFWDIETKQKFSLFTSSDSVKTEQLSEKMLEELAGAHLNLISFLDSENVPQNAKWKRVTDDIETALADTEVYEIIWQENANEAGTASIGMIFLAAVTEQGKAIIYHRWLIYVDNQTFLPKRAEHYLKSNAEQDYILENYFVFTYPRQEQVQEVVDEVFGPYRFRPNRPEYVPSPGN